MAGEAAGPTSKGDALVRKAKAKSRLERAQARAAAGVALPGDARALGQPVTAEHKANAEPEAAEAQADAAVNSSESKTEKGGAKPPKK